MLLRDKFSSASAHTRIFFLLVVITLSTATYAFPAALFEAETVHQGTLPIYSLDFGELNPNHPGPEIALLTNDGHVLVITPGEIPWSGILVVDDDDPSYGFGSRSTVSVGELNSSFVGDEIAVMSSIKLKVVSRISDSVWPCQILEDFTGYVGSAWGARVGDYRPSVAGEEIFLINENVLDCSTGTIYHCLNDTWYDQVVYQAEVGMDSAAGEFDSSHAGPEMVVTTEMGPTYISHEMEEAPWSKTMIWNDMENAGWVCKIGDVDQSLPGNELVFGTRYSNSIIISHLDYGFFPELVFTGENLVQPRNMIDIAIGNVIPETESNEIVGVDNTGNVYLVFKENGHWVGQTIWTDPLGPLYAVTVGDFQENFPGDEIVVAGESGLVTMLHHLDPSPVLDTPGWFATLQASLSNHPNPFNPTTEIQFVLTGPVPVELTVHSFDGSLVKHLSSGELPAGTHHFTWLGKDSTGHQVASGVYFYRLAVLGRTVVGRMALVK